MSAREFWERWSESSEPFKNEWLERARALADRLDESTMESWEDEDRRTLSIMGVAALALSSDPLDQKRFERVISQPRRKDAMLAGGIPKGLGWVCAQAPVESALKAISWWKSPQEWAELGEAEAPEAARAIGALIGRLDAQGRSGEARALVDRHLEWIVRGGVRIPKERQLLERASECWSVAAQAGMSQESASWMLDRMAESFRGSRESKTAEENLATVFSRALGDWSAAQEEAEGSWERKLEGAAERAERMKAGGKALLRWGQGLSMEANENVSASERLSDIGWMIHDEESAILCLQLCESQKAMASWKVIEMGEIPKRWEQQGRDRYERVTLAEIALLQGQEKAARKLEQEGVELDLDRAASFARMRVEVGAPRAERMVAAVESEMLRREALAGRAKSAKREI